MQPPLAHAALAAAAAGAPSRLPSCQSRCVAQSCPASRAGCWHACYRSAAWRRCSACCRCAPVSAARPPPRPLPAAAAAGGAAAAAGAEAPQGRPLRGALGEAVAGPHAAQPAAHAPLHTPHEAPASAAGPCRASTKGSSRCESAHGEMAGARQQGQQSRAGSCCLSLRRHTRGAALSPAGRTRTWEARRGCACRAGEAAPAAAAGGGNARALQAGGHRNSRPCGVAAHRRRRHTLPRPRIRHTASEAGRRTCSSSRSRKEWFCQ
jgi:hypothetical protein